MILCETNLGQNLPPSPAFLQKEHQSDEKHNGSHALCCSRAETLRYRFAKNSADGVITAYSPTRPYNVLSYSLFMDWTHPLRSIGELGADRRYSGVNTITMRIDSVNTRSIVLNAKELTLDSVFVHYPPNSSPIRTTTTTLPFNDEARIALPAMPRVGDTVRLSVHYSYTALQNNSDGNGFLLYSKGRLGAVRQGNDSVFVPERVCYTMSQPDGARRWMPCNDVPSDKAFCEITVRVPIGFTAVANGVVQRVEHDSVRLTSTFFYRHRFLVSPYLMAAAASRFKEYTEWYARVSNPRDSVAIKNYIWAEDDNNNPQNWILYNARRTLSTTPGTLTAYSRWFGEYPFEQYGHVVVQPFWAGGMEHQTLSTINRSWLRGVGWGIAHEIMHQWFGDKVTCRSWEHIWLNEGAASYGEALWYESWGGKRWYNDAMSGFKRNYLQGRNNGQSIYVQNPSSIDAIFNYATSYAKGAWVFHTLRQILGDEAFFRACRHYLTRFAFGTADTDDFIKAFEEAVPNPPVPFRTFVRQWIYGSGHPVYDVDWNTRPAENPTGNPTGNPTFVRFTLRQLQTGDNVPEVFTLPVQLRFQGAQGEIRTYRMFNTERTQSDTLTLPFTPVAVIADPDSTILCELTNRTAHLQPADTARTLSLQVYPQPASLSENITLQIGVDQASRVQVSIMDILGHNLGTVYQGYVQPGVWYLPVSLSSVEFSTLQTALAPGTYFLVLSAEQGQRVSQMLVLVR